MSYDIVIKNGYVMDGSGNPWFKADVGLLNGRIAKIGRISASNAEKVIDAEGMFVTPGFIDIHAHSDLALIINNKADSKVRQGVTTEVIGNCGISAAPLNRGNMELHRKHLKPNSKYVALTWSTMEDYFEKLESQGIPMNVAALVGHGTVRTAVMGFENRSPTGDELDEMKSLVEQAMINGAFGLSTGLVYPPSCFATAEEIIELCKVVAEYDGIYSTHVRGERETIVEAVKEAITIGERAKIPVQLSHNAPKYGAWGRLKETLKLVEDARKKGIDVTIDNDTQRDWHGMLTSVLPPTMHYLEIDEIMQALRDLSKREEVKREIVEDKIPGFGPVGLVKHGRWDRIILFKCEKNKEFIGKSFADIGKIFGKDPFDAYIEVLIEEKGNGEVVFKEYISEDDIETLLKHPWAMVSTDSEATASYGIFKEITSYCPASYGEYPRILEVYVRDRGVLTIEEAIRKMTSFPAQKLGVKDRGLLREGMWADIVIFDLKEVKDKATGKFPHEYPEGIRYVIVNGVISVAEEEYKGALPGKVLRHRFRS